MTPWCAERHSSKRPGTLNVFFTGEPVEPDLRKNHCALSFSRTETDDLYRLPLYVTYVGGPSELFNIPTREHLRPKVTAVARNPAHGSPRLGYAEFFSRNSWLSCAGSAFPPDLRPIHIGPSWDSKKEFLSRSMFNMAFENTNMPGYVTEKILQAFLAGTVPLWWGDLEVCHDFNLEAMIRVDDFLTVDDLFDRIRDLQNDREAYERIRNAPKFPNDTVPPWWSRQRFVSWLLGRMEYHL